MKGVLIYDDVTQRFDIFADGQSYGGLRCGETLELFEKGTWVQTRVEKDGDDDLCGWYFVGIGSCASRVGHSVRV